MKYIFLLFLIASTITADSGTANVTTLNVTTLNAGVSSAVGVYHDSDNDPSQDSDGDPIYAD